LNCRRAYPGLFTIGDYLPAQALGTRRHHVFGFSRRQDTCAAIIVVPRLMTRLFSEALDAAHGEGRPLSCAPSAVADAGNEGPLSWGRGGCSDGAHPEPSAHAVAGNAVWQDTRLL